jgi:DNA-binding YbaB/EbfC family protein
MKNFGDIQKLAQKMQADMAKAQEDLAAVTVEGSAGGGAVVVVMTGTQECKEVRIKKEAVDPEDVETLEDLVRAATPTRSRNPSSSRPISSAVSPAA